MNIRNILEGWKNFIDKPDVVEEVAKKRASICSVTRIVPTSEAMLDPTLPAKINEMIVGENSKMVDERVMYPTVYVGRSGLSMLEAVCKAITAPIKADINATIGMDLIPINSISSKKRLRNILHFSGFENTIHIIMKYLPIFCIIPISDIKLKKYERGIQNAKFKM